MKLFSAFLIFLLSSTALALPFKNIVVFGDSLSDNGNLYEVMDHKIPPSPPYHKGRFTNGLVWVEYLAHIYYPQNNQSFLENYAFGGAGISEDPGDEDLFTLKREIESYLLVHQNKAAADSLYIVWIGANNYLGIPDDVEGSLTKVNLGIRHGLEQLMNAGAKQFLIVNLPDLGQTPLASAFGNKETLSYFSRRHNELLANLISDMEMTNPEIKWLFFDINKLFNEVIASPEVYGFTNVSETCIEFSEENISKERVLNMVRNAKMQSLGSCDGYLFFDPVHPTKLAHQMIAQVAGEILERG